MVNKTRKTSQDTLQLTGFMPKDALADVEHTDDVVEYTLRCVLALAPSLSEAVARTAEAHVREMFGGEEIWLSRKEFRLQDRIRRDEAIMRDYRAGERIGLLSRRYQLSERRILQIIKA